MRALQKLSRNGNSTTLTLRREMLTYLGWLTGQSVVVEVTEDNSLLVRLPRESDFAPRGMRPRILLESPGAAK